MTNSVGIQPEVQGRDSRIKERYTTIQELRDARGNKEMSKKIRLMLVGNHELMRYGLRLMLQQEEDIEIVADYASAEEAISQIGTLSPDIVLLDTQMPRMTGIEATLQLKRNGVQYHGNVIVLADSDDDRTVALQAGAAGYFIKRDIKSQELAQAIRTIYTTGGLLEERKGFVEEVVLLVIPQGSHAAELFTLMRHLSDVLQDNCSHGSIACVAGSWDRGTVVSLSMGHMTTSDLLHKLSRMPNVAKVEELEASEAIASTHISRCEFLRAFSNAPSKTILVTLKEPVAGERRFAC